MIGKAIEGLFLLTVWLSRFSFVDRVAHVSLGSEPTRCWCLVLYEARLPHERTVWGLCRHRGDSCDWSIECLIG